VSNFRLHFCNLIEFCNKKEKVQHCFIFNQFFNVKVYFALPSQMIDQVGSLKVCLNEQFQTPFLQSHTILLMKNERPTVLHLGLFFNVQVHLVLSLQIGSLKVSSHEKLQTLLLQAHAILKLKSKRPTVFHLDPFFNVKFQLEFLSQMVCQPGTLKVHLHVNFRHSVFVTTFNFVIEK
jgi:hypothetical protein